jgi:hypothetical protein
VKTERCRGRPVSGPTGRGGASVMGCRAKRFRSAQVKTSGGTDRHRTGRVSEVAETVMRALRQRRVYRSGRGRHWTDREGTEVEPGRLAKPGKRSRPMVRSMEGRGSDVGRGSGRRDQTLSGGGCRRRLVDTVTGKPGPALWTGTAPLAERKPSQKPTAGTSRSRVGAFGQRPGTETNRGRHASNPGTPNRHRGGDRRTDHGNRPWPMGHATHGLPYGV